MIALEITGSGVPPTEEQIARLEEKLGRALPIDYRGFLLEHNGGRPRARLFSIPECGEAIVHVFAGIGTSVDIEKRTLELADDLPTGWIAIGFDPGGNVLLSDESGAVYYWDKVAHFSASSESGNTFRLTKSFSEFLKTLREFPTSK